VNTDIEIIGVYEYPLTPEGVREATISMAGEYPDHLPDPAEDVEQYGHNLSLIEIRAAAKDDRLDPGQFVQADPDQPVENWQVAYEEEFLNEDGTEVVDEPEDGEPVRLAFYLHFTQFDEPLLTPYGPLELPPPTELPERLRKLFRYVPPG
jgi:hypothetical protein